MRALLLILTFIGVSCATTKPEPDPGPVEDPFAKVESNFNVNDWIAPADIPGKYSEFEGAFRFICNVSHLQWDDPIVYPGQLGGSPHVHQFFGNTLADGKSTYKSLRSAGDSSCQGGPLNRSSYWTPVVIRGDGKAVIPANIGIYYKGEMMKSTRQNNFAITDHLPRGLRFVWGWNMKSPDLPKSHEWLCYKADGSANTAGYGTIAEMLNDPVKCLKGDMVMVRSASPPCWDGRLDSDNHRDHMAYGSYGSWGYYKCPETHTKRLTQFTILVSYIVDDPEELKGWYLSSDRMAGMPTQPAGWSFHADWFGAWDDGVKETWEEFCIEQRGNCSGFILGNGTYGKYPKTFTFDQQPRLVDPPKRGDRFNVLNPLEP